VRMRRCGVRCVWRVCVRACALVCSCARFSCARVHAVARMVSRGRASNPWPGLASIGYMFLAVASHPAATSYIPWPSSPVDGCPDSRPCSGHKARICACKVAMKHRRNISRTFSHPSGMRAIVGMHVPEWLARHVTYNTCRALLDALSHMHCTCTRRAESEMSPRWVTFACGMGAVVIGQCYPLADAYFSSQPCVRNFVMSRTLIVKRCSPCLASLV
jgi:hypothetical protein